MMFLALSKILQLLSASERHKLTLLLAAVLVMAFLEVVSIGAVLPFLGVAANPAAIQSNAWLDWLYTSLAFTSPDRFLVALGLLAFLMLLLTNAWMTVTSWAQARFTQGLSHGLSLRLIERYAAQPYSFFLSRNSASLGKNILIEVQEVIGNVVMPTLHLVTRLVVALAIFSLLVAFDPLLAVMVSAVLGGAYAVVFFAVHRRLSRLGSERVWANGDRFKAANELFGAIKDIKLLGRERSFIDAFEAPSYRYTRNLATASIIGQVPRYLLEAVAFGGVLLIAVYLLARGGALQDVIPVLGLYAFAGYRLMPSLQQVFRSLTQLRFGSAALDNIHAELASSIQVADAQREVARATAPSPCLSFRQGLELDRIAFTYPGASRPTLENLSLSIKANTTVGFMGTTGAGKTTLIDIILGLLRPDCGQIRLDGKILTEDNLAAWQRAIGYVPQHIYLTDDTIARNIAIGVPSAEIDMTAVQRAAALAKIDRFITEELSAGFATIAGERGVRLSGGQRQRIGIARALYRNPRILVFDEATSALDELTETALMDSIRALRGQRTILIIAHRLNTIYQCDQIFEISNGSCIDRTIDKIAEVAQSKFTV